MNKTELKVLGFKPAVERLRLSPSCMVGGGAVIVTPMGNGHILQAMPSMRRSKIFRSLFRRWDMHRIAGFAVRGLLECITMAGCVFFTALATILFGL